MCWILYYEVTRLHCGMCLSSIETLVARCQFFRGQGGLERPASCVCIRRSHQRCGRWIGRRRRLAESVPDAKAGQLCGEHDSVVSHLVIGQLVAKFPIVFSASEMLCHGEACDARSLSATAVAFALALAFAFAFSLVGKCAFLRALFAGSLRSFECRRNLPCVLTYPVLRYLQRGRRQWQCRRGWL